MDIQKIYNERFLLEQEYGGNDRPVHRIQPLVSVSVITYQHRDFIKDCLEGILMQQTSFPFEIIIGEDESTDGTREICLDYAHRYPDKIRLFLRDRKTSQLFDEHGKYICRFNGKWNRESARGRYIALCEGDDYWTDPLKLQKQIDFLVANPDYVLSHTNCVFYYQNKDRFSGLANADLTYTKSYDEKEDLFFDILCSKLKIRTATVVFKNIQKLRIMEDPIFAMGDTTLWLKLSQKGYFHYLNDNTAVYRISDGTISRSRSKKSKLEFKLSGCVMRFYYCDKLGYKVPNSIIDKYNKYLMDYSYFTTEIDRYIEPRFVKKETELKIQQNLKLSPQLKLVKYYMRNPRAYFRILTYKLQLRQLPGG